MLLRNNNYSDADFNVFTVEPLDQLVVRPVISDTVRDHAIAVETLMSQVGLTYADRARVLSE